MNRGRTTPTRPNPPPALARLAPPVATDDAREGDRVTLLAQVFEGTEALEHPAVVLGLVGGVPVVRYDEADLQMRATSGAPIEAACRPR